jgi:hypothetical protein
VSKPDVERQKRCPTKSAKLSNDKGGWEDLQHVQPRIQALFGHLPLLRGRLCWVAHTTTPGFECLVCRLSYKVARATGRVCNAANGNLSKRHQSMP